MNAHVSPPGFVGLPIGIGRKGAPAWRFGPTRHPAAAIRSPPGSCFGVRAEQRPGGHRPPADPRSGLRRWLGEHDVLDEQRLAPVESERDPDTPQPSRPGDRGNGPDLGAPVAAYATTVSRPTASSCWAAYASRCRSAIRSRSADAGLAGPKNWWAVERPQHPFERARLPARKVKQPPSNPWGARVGRPGRSPNTGSPRGAGGPHR